MRVLGLTHVHVCVCEYVRECVRVWLRVSASLVGAAWVESVAGNEMPTDAIYEVLIEDIANDHGMDLQLLVTDRDTVFQTAKKTAEGKDHTKINNAELHQFWSAFDGQPKLNRKWHTMLLELMWGLAEEKIDPFEYYHWIEEREVTASSIKDYKSEFDNSCFDVAFSAPRLPTHFVICSARLHATVPRAQMRTCAWWGWRTSDVTM